MFDYALTLMIFIPLLGAGVILLLPTTDPKTIRYAATAFTVPSMLITWWLLANFDPANTAPQFVQKASWIAAYNINYFVGVDGISITMVLLTGFITFLCMIASESIDKAHKGYFALFLVLEAAMFGTFCALDFFLFFIFWEVMLLPMYFLIGIWGGPRREYAAIKFFLYTLFGGVLMLVSILYLYFASEPNSFDMTMLGALVADRVPLNVQIILWLALFIGFAIKVPSVPVHTWLPDAHVEAPTAISVILAGVLLKMGTYGILRINYGILPAATLAPLWEGGPAVATVTLAGLGTISIVYGALCAMAQKDLKKLVAYSSISHMGYVMLGMSALTSQGINGAVLQMFNHGTVTAMLFLLVGVIYDRAHHRNIEGFGGLARYMPVYTGITGFAFMAALGLPGLSAFISEVLVLLGSWKAYPAFTVIAASSVVLTAGYMLWALQRIYLGPPNEKYANLPEINGRELFTLIPLAAIVLALGIYPMAILQFQAPALDALAQKVVAAAPPSANAVAAAAQPH